MKIREGAYYRAKGGRIFGPMSAPNYSEDYPWVSGHSEWDENGKCYLFSRRDEDNDFISEVYVSDTPPADVPAPEAKTLRDEFAMRLMDRDAFMVGFKEEAEQLYRAADAMMEARKK